MAADEQRGDELPPGAAARGPVAEPGGAPLFCPFCGECFEGEARCPEHDIPLVPFDQLERVRGGAAVREDELVHPYDLRFGRGWVFAGALLGLVGFRGPVVRVAYPDGENVASGYEAASTVAINLWLVPCVAATWAAIVARRRTLAAMRGARLAIPLLALLAAGSLGFTFWKMSAGAAQIVRAYGRDVLIEPRWGFWLMAVGVVLAFGGGLRLGAAKERKPRYRVD